MKKISIIVLLCAFINMSCGMKDKDGDTPDDVAKKMVNAVNYRKYDYAARLWKPGDVANIEKNYRMSFQEYCKQEIMCDTFTLSKPRKDKTCYIVYYYGIYKGTNKTYSLYIEYLDKKWYLREELIIKPENFGVNK